MLYDVIIVGGGPAGAAAAVYTARKKLKTLLITESFGGQSIVSDDIENWIGETRISGFDLAKKLENHVRAYPDAVDIKMPERVTEIKEMSDFAPLEARTEGAAAPTSRRGFPLTGFEVKTDKGSVYQGKTIILCAGARRKKLGIPGEDRLNGRGVAYCSTCDAPLFAGKTVAVVGGGNAGLEAVVDLFPYASKIYLVHRREELKGDPSTQEEIRKNPKAEIMGENFVTGLKYKDAKTGEEKNLKVGGVFVEIGSVPNSEMVKGLVELDKWGQVVIDSKHASTSHPGIFAAGDITDDSYKQNNISAGDAVKAALAAYAYLLKREKSSPAV